MLEELKADIADLLESYRDNLREGYPLAILCSLIGHTEEKRDVYLGDKRVLRCKRCPQQSGSTFHLDTLDPKIKAMRERLR